MKRKYQPEDLCQKSHTLVVRVVVPLYMPKCLDYNYVDEGEVTVGSWVEVEVGRQTCHALVVEVGAESKYKKLKPAYAVEAPALAKPMQDFYRWVARYTMAMPGDPLRAALVSGRVPQPVEPEQKLKATGEMPQRITPARQKVLDVAGQKLWSPSELATAAEVTASVVKGLVEQGCLQWQQAAEEHSKRFEIRLPTLSEGQHKAAAEIAVALHKKKFCPMLLDGVMGSGKTEVYFDTIARLLDEDAGQSLILVPEIALTPQWLKRFEARFGFKVDAWHSGISAKARRKTWHRVLEGKARVVIGARSALFLPYRNLRFIVVDEEHDTSYKQEEGFRYHGRDMAIALAKHWSCPVVLASATPSLETWHNAQQHKYQLLHLPSRFGGATLPDIKLIDMRKNAPSEKDSFLSPIVRDEILKRFNSGEQSLVFLNRRGTAPLLICSACGHRAECPDCSTSLVVHGRHLECHYCGFHEHLPDTCPSCAEEGRMRSFGPGTRKILEEVQRQFPDANVAVADSDAITTSKKMTELVENMESGKIDILVGTQMVAKGHHFPNLTFVAVIDSDMGLGRGELRAAEHTFQMLMQVSGRAGREGKNGAVYLQSYMPEHPLFRALIQCDRDGFLNMELTARQIWNDPPFVRQVALIFSGKNERDVQATARALATDLARREGLEVMGPVAAPLARLKGKYRYRLLIKSTAHIQKQVLASLSAVPLARAVRLDVDVDPVSFM